MFRFKRTLVSFVVMSLMGCSAKDMQSQSTTGVSAAKLSDAPVIPVEGADPIEVTSNNLPVDASDVPNELLNLINLPAQQQNSGGGFLSGLLGGGNNSCNLINSLLPIGSTLLGGGNPLIGSLISGLAGSLFKCGSQSSLANLLPSGTSSSNQIFTLLSQILNVSSLGKDPTALLNAIKNPQDLSGLLSVVSNLTHQTQNNDLNKLLTLIQNFQNQTQGSVGTCGSMNPIACQMFNLINQTRLQNGLSALSPNNNCTAAAQFHSKDMFSNLILSHLSSDGTTAKDRLAQFGVTGAWAENIIKGASLSAPQALQTLLNSANHKKNILNPLFTSGGVGFINGYFTQCFTN